jgi:sugar phosphate permease
MLFLCFGLGALVWLPLWYWAMPHGSTHGGPEPVPRKSNEDLGTVRPVRGASILSIVRLPCAWGSFIGHFCGNYFYYFLLTWLPTYLVQEEHLSIGAMSRLTSLIFTAIACSTIVCGFASDRLIAKGVSPSIVRRSLASGGLVVASTLIPLSMVHGHAQLALGLMFLAGIGQGAYTSNHWAVTQTLAGPVMAGRWSSLQNGFANFSGIAAPWLTGLILQREGSMRLAFTVTGVVTLIGGISFGLLVRRVEQVDWEALARS